MKLVRVSAVAALLVAGCATTSGSAWTPTIDTQGVSQAKYERDLAECRQYAEAHPGADSDATMKKGAMLGLGGAAGMAAFTVATGGVGAIAALPMLGASAGSMAVLGGANGKVVGDAKYKSMVHACLSGRGYKVLG